MGHVLNYIKTNKLLSLMIALGFFFQMLIIIPSGTYLCYQKSCGIQFWGVHSHDTIWHLALASVAFQKMPFVSPIYSGALLTGYNFLLDLIANAISKSGVSLFFIYFKLFPILWFLGFTYLLIKLGRKLHKSSLFVSILLFFAYFGGSFAFFFTLYHKGNLEGASGMLAMQALLTLTNLQFAFSLICMIALLYLFNMVKPSTRRNVLIGVIVFLSFGLKFYAGVIGLFYVGIYMLLDLVLHKRLIKKYFISQILFYTIIAVSVISSVFFFYNPFSSLKSGFPLVFSPFAIVHSMIEDPSLFYLRDLTNARYFLYSKGFGPRLIGIELFTTLLFIFFNLGSRFFGILYLGYKAVKKKINMFDLTTFLTVVFSFGLSITFIQKGEWWNSIQFSYFGIFLSIFFIAEFIYLLLRKKNVILIIFALVLLLSNIPENIDVIRGFNPFRASAYVSQQELAALNFLKKLPDGIVYVPIFGYTARSEESLAKTSPIPVFAAVDSAYVSAFTGKQSYITDINVLNITGVDYTQRLKNVMAGDCGILNNIRYIYVVNGVRDTFIQKCMMNIDANFRIIYQNDTSIIYSSTS